jgi:hypothetical protein
LDAAARKVQILKNELLVKNKKLTDVSEKLRQAAFDRDASILREEMTSTTLKTTQKELADVKKELAEVKDELANAKKEEGSDSRASASRNSSASGGRNSRGDLLDELCARKQIELDAFREKSEITQEFREKEERKKRSRKSASVSHLQANLHAMGSAGGPFGGGGAGHSSRG